MKIDVSFKRNGEDVSTAIRALNEKYAGEIITTSLRREIVDAINVIMLSVDETVVEISDGSEFKDTIKLSTFNYTQK